MRATLAIASRELASCFRTSIGWVVLALYLLLSGLWFALQTLQPGEPASMRALLDFSQWLLLMVAPAISMRLFAEELRTGTIDPLMSTPASDWAIVIGKYLGGVGFLVVMLGATLIHVGVLELVANPDYGPILAGYSGLLLVGGLYLAVGTLFSSLTKNQVVAFLATLFFFLVLFFASGPLAQQVGTPWNQILFALSIPLRQADFAKGVLETRHVVFFVAWICVFIAGAVAALESRRWR